MIQLQVLNKVLETKDSALISLNNIDTSYFSDYKEEFKFIKNHIDTYGNVPDIETFLSNFPNFELIKVNESSDYLIDELFKDKSKRLLANSFNKVRDLVLNNKIEEAVELYVNSTDSVIKAKHIDSIDILTDTSRYNDYLERCNDYSKYYVKTGFPELDQIIGGWDRQEELATIAARTNVGKCLEKGTQVLLGDGSLKKIEEVKIGDKVQSLNRVNNVIALHNGISKGYKIIPTNGEPFTVSENHILTLLKLKQTWDKEKKMSTTNHEYELVDIMIEDFLKIPEITRKHLYRLYKPSIEYNTKEYLIPPYILGLWLGDGTSCRPELTSMDDVIIEQWTSYAESKGLHVRKSKSILITSKKRLSKAHSYDITKGYSRGKNKIKEDFKYYNLLNNKHIPLEYLTGDRNQRLELLAGIIDTDAYYNGTGYEITLANETLVKNIMQLARGLGFRCTNISYRKNRYTTVITGPYLFNIPVKLEYKKAKEPNNFNREIVATTFDIEEVKIIEYYGFECDGDHRFMLYDNTLTHNTWVLLKIATAAAQQGLNVGIYSGEMSARKVGYRIDTLISHISNIGITKGNLDLQTEYKRYIENMDSLVPGHIRVLTPDAIGGPAGVTALRAFIEKDNLDMLFIDQHSLLEDDRRAKNPVEKAANISKDLKNLQVLKKIPIISVSQQNRTSTENGVGTQHIAQSDRIAQDSTIVIFFERQDNILSLELVKSRDSVNNKKLSYAIDLDKGIFQYLPEEDNALDGQGSKELREEFEEENF